MKVNKIWKKAAVFSTALFTWFSFSALPAEAASEGSQEMYRLYNPNSGEHFYTANYNERNYLDAIGWNYEGIGWYSDDAKTVPLYRQYNPNARSGAHNYTSNKGESDHLVSLGWHDEGIGWYGLPASAAPVRENIDWTEDNTKLFVHVFKGPGVPSGSWEDAALKTSGFTLTITGADSEQPLVYTADPESELTLVDTSHDSGALTQIGTNQRQQGYYVLSESAPGTKIHIKTSGAPAGYHDIDDDFIIPGEQYKVKNLGSAKAFTDLHWASNDSYICLSIFLG